MRRVAQIMPALLAGALLVGCGSFQPFATPFPPRPPLPAGDVWPHLTVEEVIEHIETLGLDCRYAPDSDIEGGWICQELSDFENLAIDVDAQETGLTITNLGVTVMLSSRNADQAGLDHRAAERFREDIIVPLLPQAAQPSEAEIVEMVADNWPTELGDGWGADFHRSAIRRSMSLLYSAASADE